MTVAWKLFPKFYCLISDSLESCLIQLMWVKLNWVFILTSSLGSLPRMPWYLQGSPQCYKPMISALGNLRQEDKFRATLGMVFHAFLNTSTQTEEVGGFLWAWSHPSLHSKFQTSQGNMARPCLNRRRWGGEGGRGKRGMKLLLKAIVGCILNLRPAWDIWDPVSKTKTRQNNLGCTSLVEHLASKNKAPVYQLLLYCYYKTPWSRQ